jgi:hypothetical protein
VNRILHYILLWSTGVLLTTNIGCSLTAEEISTDPNLQLQFSSDTVFFDTVFSQIPTITKRLRVYNNNASAVSIASIDLADLNSPYVLTVNGVKGTSFQATRLLANDSLLILVDALLDDRNNDLPYIIEDRLVFNTNGNIQEIPVISWGQDAIFLRDSILTCNAVWTKGKPYVIYDNVLVDSLCTLTIEAGAQVFSHKDSHLFVQGTLNVLGTKEERVLITNDRFDGAYRNFPGQWQGITFLPGSANNTIQYANIRNAAIGIYLGTPDDNDDPDLVVENTVIENMSQSAIAAFTSDLEMNNCLLNNSGQILFAGLAGGNYSLTHNTFSNYGYGLFKSQPTFYVSNELELADGSFIQGPVNLTLNNNIIWGTSNDEIIFGDNSDEPFVLIMSHNLLRTTNDFFNGFDNIINQDPLFIDSEAFNYQLDEGSPAINTAIPLGFTIDLLGVPRMGTPDIGAYERQ